MPVSDSETNFAFLIETQNADSSSWNHTIERNGIKKKNHLKGLWWGLQGHFVAQLQKEVHLSQCTGNEKMPETSKEATGSFFGQKE